MIISKIKKIAKGIVLENEPMSRHTSYGIGGEVSAYITPFDRDDLIRIINFNITTCNFLVPTNPAHLNLKISRLRREAVPKC